MKGKPRIFFRADGNSKIGLGHVFRSLALAEVLNDTFECHFIIIKPSKELKDRVLQVCDFLIELSDSTSLILETKNLVSFIKEQEIIIIDGYQFDVQYQKTFKENNIKVICIDDLAESHFVADAVINHSGGFTKADYSVEKYTKLYLGPQYALLRKPFRAKNLIEKENNLFICLGGADPENKTIEILYKLESCKESAKCFLVIGSAYIYKKELSVFLERTSLVIDVLNDLSADEMHHYMSMCARAITPPSTVSYEYLTTGGLLFLKQIADNQKNIQSYLLKNKLALSFDDDFKKSSSLKVDGNLFLREKANPFDGRQTQRLRDIFYDLMVSVKVAQLSDCKMYFEWINDEDTRQQSFSSEKIDYQTHKNWFNKRIQSEDSVLCIMCLGNEEIGQVRFEKNEASAVLSYSVDKKFRRKGLGFWVLEKGLAFFRKRNPDIEIIGYVKMDNLASVKLFRRLKFKENVSNEYKNSYQYIYS
ncbi:UDP-2,4-diacetamido-2,4,6-trideoxy-beta-L-altropyranose hydrolase [uncultured Arcticibacterium sp.]|uniref:UDP-2,4-diacetamido-2,4, 6-trideoxy-beta-L-altropyranose hydrolase n=1 Tax=uncultured Arcticibacterium sp. TaxID=2173042 RepID=UPI0030FA260A